ncbi:MAG: hypothetical protein N2749_00675 [Clostridia bacterium]|nr:hypothetical protein [Clostridia bacterium]
MASNFYKDLLEHDFYEEKTASEHSNTIDLLNSFSADQIEAIAEELGLLFEKEAEEETVESKIVEQSVKKKEEPKKEEKKSEEENLNADSKEKIPELLQKQKQQPQQQEESKNEEGKEALEIEEEIIKLAYAIAEEKLASLGISVFDYTLNKVANEDVAIFVTDKAEKLAYVTEKSPFQVVDDILGEVGSIINSVEE